jgi:hypothetical protein
MIKILGRFPLGPFCQQEVRQLLAGKQKREQGSALGELPNLRLEGTTLERMIA